ncbi:MAG TPA: tetratricopeptide repeat protein [Eoetvoesiella sp.]
MKLPISLCLTIFTGLSLQFPAVAAAAQAEKSRERVEQIHLRAGEFPAVTLTADILYRILASEIAAQRGEYDMASQTLLDLSKDTSDPRLAKRAFQFAMADRDVSRALSAAREWAQLAPDDPEAVASSLALAASRGETAGLAAALWNRIDKASDKNAAIAQAAVIVNKMNDKQMALEVLDKALREPVRNILITRLALADAAWAAADAPRALSEAQQALALDPNSEPAAQRVLEYGLKVDPVAAINATQTFAAKHPEARKLQLLLINRLAQRNDFDGALAQMAKMRKTAPEDFDLLYTEAEINFHAGRYDRAKALLNEYINVQMQRRRSISDKATNAMADASDARLLLVKIAEKEGLLNEAIVQLGLIDDPALRFQARVHQAVLQARQGNLNQARKTIEDLKPQDKRERTVVALTLASIYRESGRTDLAIETLAEADKAMPDTSEIKYDLAMLYERQGKYEEFEKLLRRVIELEPENSNAYNSLGYTFADQNTRLDEAQELLDRALELDPDSPFILDSVGWYLFRTGANEEALEYLQRSYEQMPTADVAAHLGEVLWKLKRYNAAKQIWRAGLAKDASNETLLKTLKRLEVRL